MHIKGSVSNRIGLQTEPRLTKKSLILILLSSVAFKLTVEILASTVIHDMNFFASIVSNKPFSKAMAAALVTLLLVLIYDSFIMCVVSIVL